MAQGLSYPGSTISITSAYLAVAQIDRTPLQALLHGIISVHIFFFHQPRDLALNVEKATLIVEVDRTSG